MEFAPEDEAIKNELLESNEQFRSLYQQHATLKEQVEEIERKAHISEADELEEQRLKKLKLHVKDQLKGLLSQHRPASVA